MNCLPTLTIKNGHPVATSLAIAEDFKKQHKDVLRAIQNIECSEAFSRRNFAPSDYLDERGKTQPMVEMTRDGFAFLCMGFTGKEAAQWKEAYIAQFNAMEAAQAANPAHPGLLREVQTLQARVIGLQDRLIESLQTRPVLADGQTSLRRTWTPEEEARLRELWAKGLGYTRIGRQMGRTHDSIKGHLKHLSITRAAP